MCTQDESFRFRHAPDGARFPYRPRERTSKGRPLPMAMISNSHPMKPATDAPPALFSWGARALYIGPALGLSAHRNAVAVLALGLDAHFALSAAPADPNAPLRSCRSALIPPNTLHRLVSKRG